MNAVPITAFACVALMSLQPAMAQGGRGRGRAEEILNRVGTYFTDTAAPAADGDKPIDLAKTDMVLAASGAGQPCVLYLFDGSDDQDVRQQFERTMFAGDEIGIMLRCFHCGSIDLQKADALKKQFAKQQPLFLVFDAAGKASDAIAMSGYKASVKSLENQLVKAAQGVIKPSLAAFAKDYGGFVRDLEQLLDKKKIASARAAKAGADKTKKAEAEKDLAAIEKDEKKLLEQESKLLEKTKLPERPSSARRLGDRFPGGGRGGGGGGGGAGGGGG